MEPIQVGRLLEYTEEDRRELDMLATLLLAQVDTMGHGVAETTLRIFKVTHGEPPALRKDLATLPTAELVRLQTHTNDWFVRQARRLLQERHASGGELRLG